MAKRIDLSFRTNPTVPMTSDAQDTAVPEPDAGETHDRNMAKLEQLRIGEYTVAEVVRTLGTALGKEFYASEIHQQDVETAKVFLEPKKLDRIYDITDGGHVDTSMARIFGTTDRLHDHMPVGFQTKFTQPPSVMVGLNYLHEDRSENVRIAGKAEQIHHHLFDLHSYGWCESVIYGAGFTWLAIPSYQHPLLQVGTFDTASDHRRSVKQDLTHKIVTFRSPYKSPPKIVVWLSSIDTKRQFNDRVMAFATDVTETGFTLHVNTWGDSWLHGAEVSWFAYPADTPGICSGSIQPKITVGVVTFDKPFAKPPRRILVALNKLDMDKAKNCRFKIIHEAVSERGMAVRVETWGNSNIISSGVAYIAME